MHRKIKQQLK